MNRILVKPNSSHPARPYAAAARPALYSALATALFSCAVVSAAAQVLPAPPSVTVPPSSIAGPNDTGSRFHTNLEFLSLAKGAVTPNGPPFPGAAYNTPSSIACVYGLQPAVAGCNPYNTTLNPAGGSRAIAVVDAYDNPNIYYDTAIFNSQFAVTTTPPNVVYAPSGAFPPGACTGPATQPPSAAGTGWDIEASLDVQWAHAMAPGAALYLVEAQSSSLLDLLCAVSVAGSLVSKAGGGEISMSFGGAEFNGENIADPVFTTPGIVYFASTGDTPGVIYPSASPNVIAVGGTSISRNVLSDNFRFENTWQETGGGLSAFEARPAYQNSITGLVGASRGVPDVSADANVFTGVWVFNSSNVPECVPAGCWFIVGGTSLSSPLWAGITNAAGHFLASSAAELSRIYADPPQAFNDITVGTCGLYMGEVAAAGWDFCSGQGTPKGYPGK